MCIWTQQKSKKKTQRFDCLIYKKEILILITHEDNERLRNDLIEIVSNNVDHENEMYY